MLLACQRITCLHIPAGEIRVGQRGMTRHAVVKPSALAVKTGIFRGAFETELRHRTGVDIAGIDSLGSVHRQFRTVAETEHIGGGGVGRSVRRAEDWVKSASSSSFVSLRTRPTRMCARPTPPVSQRCAASVAFFAGIGQRHKIGVALDKGFDAFAARRAGDVAGNIRRRRPFQELMVARTGGVFDRTEAS